METIFDIGYLGAVIILGALMIKNCRGDRQFFLFGIMGKGDFSRSDYITTVLKEQAGRSCQYYCLQYYLLRLDC